MNIVGNKVILRAMEQTDCELVCNMFNDPNIEDLVVGWAFPLSRYAQDKWYEKHYADGDFRFVIELKETGEAVGVATLVNIDWKNRKADHGIKIAHSDHRHKGIGMDTVMAIMRYAFDELGLNRLNGSWFPENTASKNMYMKCGWKEEGIRKNYIFKHGQYRDLIETGILAQDYYKLVNKNHYWNTNLSSGGGV